MVGAFREKGWILQVSAASSADFREAVLLAFRHLAAAQRRVRSCLESLFYRLSLIIVPPPGAGSQQRPPPGQSGIRVGPKVIFFEAACWLIFRSRKPFKSALGPISNPLGFRKPPGSNLGAILAPKMKLF